MAAVIVSKKVTLAAGSAAANLNTILGATLSATGAAEIKIRASAAYIQIGPTGLNVSSAPGLRLPLEVIETFQYVANDDPGTTVFLQTEEPTGSRASIVDIYVRTV